ncbi:FtsB family cell division protein [Rhizohabitans arisaemae]|uniref:FtsB family cell division protein n=1 Tax=Rhizohabitans arisaemae TaxID=2720610 RepID=UPI0024B204C4|nr:septum formation initiator family protein [Rhizohabitans arisaemae]
MVKRPQLTGRAAILAVVVCVIAMSLAYPFREYVAQRRQIEQLQREQETALVELRELERQRQQLSDPNYIKGEARRRLHMCDPGEKCYVVLDDEQTPEDQQAEVAVNRLPWYQMLWESVEAARDGTGRRADAQSR